MINLIGLGKMGYNLYQNMIDNNIAVLAYDESIEQRQRCDNQENIVESLEQLYNSEYPIYWLMLPAGEITEMVFLKLLDNIPAGSIIIEAGNAHYKDSIRRFDLAKQKGISVLDCGTSGGQDGARNGACMMVGGDMDAFSKVEDYLTKLCVKDGLLYTGKSGSGHYLKMVHNGIEYGMMQSIAEGFNVLENSDLYNFDNESVARLFNNGSVVRSWLMELLEDSFKNEPHLESIAGIVPSSGEGKWTVEEALRLGLNIPVITQSLMARYASNDTLKFSEKVNASLRNQFGGHAVHTKE